MFIDKKYFLCFSVHEEKKKHGFHVTKQYFVFRSSSKANSRIYFESLKHAESDFGRFIST